MQSRSSVALCVGQLLRCSAKSGLGADRKKAASVGAGIAPGPLTSLHENPIVESAARVQSVLHRMKQERYCDKDTLAFRPVAKVPVKPKPEAEGPTPRVGWMAEALAVVDPIHCASYGSYCTVELDAG